MGKRSQHPQSQDSRFRSLQRLHTGEIVDELKDIIVLPKENLSQTESEQILDHKEKEIRGQTTQKSTWYFGLPKMQNAMEQRRQLRHQYCTLDS